MKGAAAQNFLETKLSQSTATWRFVVTHFPIYSGGSHGPQDDVCWVAWISHHGDNLTSYQELVTALENILLTYQPDAYFCGHDHSEQHVAVNGMNYFVIGGGSEVVTNNAGSAGLGSQLKFMFPKCTCWNTLARPSSNCDQRTVTVAVLAPSLWQTRTPLFNFGVQNPR